MTEDFIQIKVNISVPKTKWLAIYNKKYPELTFNIFSKYLIDDNTGVTLFQVAGVSLNRFLAEFKSRIAQDAFQILFEGEDRVILNIKTSDPWILSALVKTELLIMYPIPVKEGKIQMDTITSRKKFDLFLTELDAQDIKYSIKSVGYFRPIPLLTENQKEILNLAVKHGYFEIPRKISLTEFAKRLEISPSALSETLRRINYRLAKNYLLT